MDVNHSEDSKSNCQNTSDVNHSEDSKFKPNENSDKLNYEKIVNNKLFCTVYIIWSFLYVGWSAYEFCQAYKNLKKIKENIKDYEKKLKKKKFNERKDKIGIFPNGFKESLKIIKEVLIGISNDYNDLEELIKEIN